MTQVIYKVYDAVAMKTSKYHFASYDEATREAERLTEKHRFIGTLPRFTVVADTQEGAR
jgi:hypothetical protein